MLLFYKKYLCGMLSWTMRKKSEIQYHLRRYFVIYSYPTTTAVLSHCRPEPIAASLTHHRPLSLTLLSLNPLGQFSLHFQPTTVNLANHHRHLSFSTCTVRTHTSLNSLNQSSVVLTHQLMLDPVELGLELVTF